MNSFIFGGWTQLIFFTKIVGIKLNIIIIIIIIIITKKICSSLS
jgi:hypothetical protein